MTAAAVAPVAYHRDRVTRIAFLALFAFGIVNAYLGPALPYLRHDEGISYVGGALHQAAYAVGGLLAGIAAARGWILTSRRTAITVGLAGAAAAAIAFGYGPGVVATVTASLLLSAFATTALIRVWALLAEAHRAHRAVAMTEGEVVVSLAGVVVPAVVGVASATALGWRASSLVVALIVVVAAVASGRTRLPDTSTPESGPAAPAGTSDPRRTLFVIFAVVGTEIGVTFWAATYLHDDVGLARDTAVAMVSALYAANLVGRGLASRLARRARPRTLLIGALVVALAGAPVLLTASGTATAVVGLVVVGTGIGAMFPLASALHVAASPHTADRALGQTLTVAGIAQIGVPLVVGAVAQVADLRVGLLLMPALVLLAGAVVVRGQRA